jgi:type IV pilus assembly protein PilO
MAITKEELIKLPKWQKVLILAGVILLLGGVWYFLLYSPSVEKISTLQKDLQRLKRQIQEQERAKRTKRTLEAQIKALQQELTILRAKLPEEKEIPNLLDSVTEIGRLNGLNFLLFRQESSVRKDYYSEIPVSVRVQGGFHQVMHFLAKVGSMDRILHVSELKMEKYKPVDGGGFLQASMKATTYKYESTPLPKKKRKGKRKGRRR